MALPPARLTAALADRYRVERELGAGGYYHRAAQRSEKREHRFCCAASMVTRKGEPQGECSVTDLSNRVSSKWTVRSAEMQKDTYPDTFPL